ncbi:MAG: DUF3782 domain-containing protein [Nitrospirae bacterium]|nr:DUF3782 domain-containing protein [Nitrospirota bacterium]
MTFEDVMKGFEEIRKEFVEIKETFREANRRIEQEAKERQERDAKEEKEKQEKEAREAKERQEEKEKKAREAKERQEKEAKKEKEAKAYEARMQRSERIAERANMAVSNLSDKWGEFVEGMVWPAVVRLFKRRGIKVDHISRYVERKSGNCGIEIDILAVNGEYVIAIEVKSTLLIKDIKDHIQRLKKFRLLFKEYENRKLIGAVAGIVIKEGSYKFAYDNGMFVIGQSGDSVKFLNDKEFVPRYY